MSAKKLKQEEETRKTAQSCRVWSEWKYKLNLWSNKLEVIRFFFPSNRVNLTMLVFVLVHYTFTYMVLALNSV